MQIVEDADVVSLRQEQVDSMRADKAGSAGDETEGHDLLHRLVYHCRSPVAVKNGGKTSEPSSGSAKGLLKRLH